MLHEDLPAQGGGEQQDPGDGEGEDGHLNLPEEFWGARPYLGHIRDAAHSMLVSPDSVLGGVLTRYAATVPPSIVLPNAGTLDLFVIIHGHSGAGKSMVRLSAGRT